MNVERTHRYPGSDVFLIYFLYKNTTNFPAEAKCISSTYEFHEEQIKIYFTISYKNTKDFQEKEIPKEQMMFFGKLLLK